MSLMCIKMKQTNINKIRRKEPNKSGNKERTERPTQSESQLCQENKAEI